jgi:hypothetical protein
MTDDEMVIWSAKKLAREFDMSRQKVGRLLKRLGAKRYTNSTYIWKLDYYDSELQA